MKKLFLLFLLIIPTLAQAGVKRLAVLDFRGVGLDENTLFMFSDAARNGVIQAVDAKRVTVMTRENVAVVLEDNGIDISECTGSCEVDIARKMSADYVLTGSIGKIGSDYVLTLKLHDTLTGGLLSVNEADSDNLNTLRKATVNLSRKLVVEGIGAGSSGSDQSGKAGFSGDFDDDWDITETKKTIINFTSKPSKAIVMLDGELLCQETPCSKEVVAGGHKLSMQKERYQKKTQTIDIQPGKDVEFSLDPDFGYLNVSSSVSNVMLFVDGEPAGLLPQQNLEVDKGAHVLTIEDPCYLGKEYRFSIKAGQTENVNNYPIKERSSGVSVSVQDTEGNAKPAKISVDGVYLGTSPLTKKVPLCSEMLTAEFDGKSKFLNLELTEKEVSEVNVVLGEEKKSNPSDSLSVKKLQKSCDKGKYSDCVSLGWKYDNGEGVSQNFKKAVSLYDRACSNGDMLGCNNLGYMYEKGRGVKIDTDKAFALYKRACDGKDMLACNNLGGVYSDGRIVKQNYNKAFSLYKKACDNGSVKGCFNLGWMYDQGFGTSQSYPKAFSLYQRACNKGDMLGCNNLGVLYRDAKGVGQDYALAVVLFQQACEGGELLGCASLGYMYDVGFGVKKDYSKAFFLYKKACDGDEMWGCNNLGFLYQYGHGVTKDSTKAYVLYERACVGGNIKGCEHLESMNK